MAILFYDGFDINNIDGDEGYFWTPGSGLHSAYDTAGYLEGSALAPFRTSSLISSVNYKMGGNTFPSSTGKVRWYFWANTGTTSASTSYSGSLTSFNWGWAASNSLMVKLDAATGYLQLAYGNPGPVGTKTTVGSAIAGLSSTYQCYECYFDSATGEFTVKQNGVQILTYNFGATWQTVTGNPIVGFGASSSILPNIDHFVLTDGEALTGSGPLAIGVAGTVDPYNASTGTEFFGGSGDGFRGSILVNGVTYKGSGVSFNASSGGTTNFAPIAQWQWMANPDTSSPWTSLSEIEAWGVCGYDQNSDGSISAGVRTTSMSLTYVELDSSGFPLVKFQKPGQITYFSGTWVKSDDSLSYAAHVNDIPRTILLADDKWLVCESTGCILFSPTVTTPVVGVDDNGSLGLSFAEEYRTDYKDWVKVDDVGNSYDSYFISGYGVYGQINKQFQSNYVTVNYENVPYGSAYIQGVWDYSIDNASNRWSQKQQIYAPDLTLDSHFKHRNRKLKIRGHGNALQLRVSNQGNNPFAVNGWSLFVTGNVNV